MFHAVIEVKKFDSNTGKRQSVPRVQKFGKKSFESGGVRDNLKRQGYDITILHDPNKWLEENQAATKEQEAENKRIALEQQQEREEQLRIKKEKEDQQKIDDAVAKQMIAIQKSMAASNQKAIEDGIKTALAAQKKTEPKVTPAADAAKTNTTGTATT